VLDEPLGLLDHHLRHRDMPGRRLVEGRGDDLALHRALHVRHFLRPLVDEQNDQVALRMVLLDRVGDVLQDDGLAGPGRRHDQAALALSDRRDEVDDPRRAILDGRILDLHLQPLVGVERRQIVEVDLVPGLLRILEVDRADLHQPEIAFVLLRRPDDALDRVAGAEAEFADLVGTDIDVVGAGEVVRLGRPEEAETVLEHLEDAIPEDLDTLLGHVLEDGEHHVALPHRRGVLDLELLGELEEIGRALGLQVGERELLEVCREIHRGSGKSGGGRGNARPARWNAEYLMSQSPDRVKHRSSEKCQKGLTTTRMTMTSSASVGTSFIAR
jgi:hypothetical protein